MLNKFLLRVAPPCLAFIMRIWFLTCRLTVHNSVVLDEKSETPLVASFWHYSIIFLFYHMRKRLVTAMVSASKDGEYIARLAGEFGFDTVRGSRNNRSVGALKGLLRAVRRGNNLAIVADGSQGPARQAQPGAVLVASRTGTPIIPMAWSASRHFVIHSWDRTAIPYPFSRIDLFYGDLIKVPPDLDAEGLERYRVILEEKLNELYAQAWSLHDKMNH
jgi:lysophospholipid acyltransferase (LPLAT)-like uncharacterized protein